MADKRVDFNQQVFHRKKILLNLPFVCLFQLLIRIKILPASGQLRRIPIDGGAPEVLTDENVNAIAPMVSPDGKWIACSYSSPQFRAATPATAFRTAVIPIDGGAPVKVFDLLGGPENDFGWTADGTLRKVSEVCSFGAASLY